MKKVLFLLCIMLLSLIVSCEIGSIDDDSPEQVILFTPSSYKLNGGDSVTIRFGYKSDWLIDDGDVTIRITNSDGIDVTDEFDPELASFSATEVLDSSSGCVLRLFVDEFAEDDIYTVRITIDFGFHSDSETVGLAIGDVSMVNIQSVENGSLVTGSTQKDTIQAFVVYGDYLTTSHFFVTFDESGSIPGVKMLSYSDGRLLIELSATSTPTGTYHGLLQISGETHTKAFTVTVNDLPDAKITSVQDIQLKEGESGTTTASVSNGDGLWSNDFTVSVADSDSTIFTPTAEIDGYSNGTVTITVDASHADPGTYYGTLSLEGSSRGFTIRVLEM